jgi:hypothetical protein
MWVFSMTELRPTPLLKPVRSMMQTPWDRWKCWESAAGPKFYLCQDQQLWYKFPTMWMEPTERMLFCSNKLAGGFWRLCIDPSMEWWTRLLVLTWQ